MNIMLTGIMTAMILGIVSGCGTSHPSGASLTFDQLYENISQFQDSTVGVEGRYLGWSGKDCQFPAYAAAQLTRSDWAFNVGDQCLYVTGGKPAQVDMMDDQFVGQSMRLEAVVRLTSEKKMYLEYVNSTFTK